MSPEFMLTALHCRDLKQIIPMMVTDLISQCGRLKNGSQRCPQFQSAKPVNVTLCRERELCRCDSIKDLKMGKLYWIIWVDTR